MRILVAPDSFGETLTAVEAVAAIVEGWQRHAPADELTAMPMSDGGPGFVDVMHASVGGELLAVTIANPSGDDLPAAVLRVGDTAYVEAAQAAGSHPTNCGDAEHASTIGVGRLIAAAIDDGATTIVVGLGGIRANDGGAGLLAALGATATPSDALVGGPAGLATIDAVSIDEARARVAGVDLQIVADVDALLLGLRGTTNLHGEARGLDRDQIQRVDAQLERFATLVDRRLADKKYAGAGGGIGFALLALGASSAVDGLSYVADTLDLTGHAALVDLVVTGEGLLDFAPRSGRMSAMVAARAGAAVRPCIALAGEVLIGAREMRTLGIESSYSVIELVGRDRADAEPVASLAALAERVARTWSH